MNEMADKEKQKIIDALSKRGAIHACPRCGKKKFTLLDGYFNQPIQLRLTSSMLINGPSVPSIVVVCRNCGYMSQHALGVLGLLPQKQGDEK